MSNNNDTNVTGFEWFMCVMGFLIGCFIMIYITGQRAKEDAVKHHAAQWVTQPTGAVDFKWNDEINIEKKEK